MSVTDGTQADGDSAGPAMSADGRSIAFESPASNLVSGDTNAARDVFVVDRMPLRIYFPFPHYGPE